MSSELKMKIIDKKSANADTFTLLETQTYANR